MNAFYFQDAVQNFSMLFPKPLQLNPTIENAAYEVTKLVTTGLHTSSWTENGQKACWDISALLLLFAQAKQVKEADKETLTEVFSMTPA